MGRAEGEGAVMQVKNDDKGEEVGKKEKEVKEEACMGRRREEG